MSLNGSWGRIHGVFLLESLTTGNYRVPKSQSEAYRVSSDEMNCILGLEIGEPADKFSSARSHDFFVP